jgi:exosortase C (VPDSG-CTERM-specific)
VAARDAVRSLLVDTADSAARRSAARLRGRLLAAYLALLTLAYAPVLARLFSHALASELHSYIPLIPLIAGYLLYTRSPNGVTAYGSSTVGFAVTSAIAGLVLVAANRLAGRLSINDYLALITASYLLFAVGGMFLLTGALWIRQRAFAIAFLAFLVPLPDAAVFWLERGSVLASADVSELFLRWADTPLVREGTIFAVPGFVFEVAQECSGIRSSWILFITSLVASHLFLQRSSHRVILVLFIIPLAIARNALRILTIALLCVHVGPHMIDSVIHRRGGPIFFVLSLMPLCAALLLLRRLERRPTAPHSTR